MESHNNLEYEIIKYKLTTNALGIALWDMEILNHDFENSDNIITWSQELRDMLGFENEKDFPNVLGSLLDRIHPDQLEYALTNFTNHLNDHTGNSLFDVEYRLKHKQGHYNHYHALGYAERNSTGAPVRVAGSLRCIDEKVKQEEASAKIEQELRAELQKQTVNERIKVLFEAAPISIFRYENGSNLAGANKTAVKLFGFDSEQNLLAYVKGTFPFLSPVHQPCGTLSTEVAARCVEEAMTKGHTSFEWMHHDIHGTPIPTEVDVIRLDVEDRVEMVSFVRDMREAKANQAKTEEAISQQRQMYESNPVPSSLWDTNFAPVDCNDAMVNLLGLSDRSDFKEKFMQFTPPVQANGLSTPDMVQKIGSTTLVYGFYRYPWTFLDPNGNEIPGEATCTRIDLPDRQYFSVHFLDMRKINAAMAEAKRIEVVEESNRAKSQFLARMSHEIRTPISTVMGISEIQLQNNNLPPIIEESFAKIYNSSNTLLGIINDILDLSKIEAGKMDLLQEEYDVASMISDVSHAPQQIEDKDISFNIDIDEKIPAMLIGDTLRIKQVLNNVLSNAFKYTQQGAINLSIKHVDDYANHNGVIMLISVRDTGMGMTKEQVESLFSEYTRFHELSSRHISGTGLGMPIVYNLAKMMDATLNITSDVGVGTEVVIKIPQQKASNAQPLGKDVALSLQRFESRSIASLQRQSFSPEPLPYGKVLVVDDIEANLYVARGLLDFYQLNIETCTSGYAAIDKIQQGNTYDIIFMDQTMPGIDGTQTLAHIRDLGYTKPIIALTANAFIGQAEEFVKNGFNGFISKPIQTTHLHAILLKHIKDKNPAKALELSSTHAKASNVTIHNFQNNNELVQKLRIDFAKTSKNLCADLKQAYAQGDIGTAHRLAHTLKGIAGLIHETKLVQLAERIEKALHDGNTPDSTLLDSLEIEHKKVLDSIEIPDQTPPHSKAIDKQKLTEILQKIEPLVKANNIECLSLLDDLRTTPEAAILIRQIEELDFAIAEKSLKTLKEIIA